MALVVFLQALIFLHDTSYDKRGRIVRGLFLELVTPTKSRHTQRCAVSRHTNDEPRRMPLPRDRGTTKRRNDVRERDSFHEVIERAPGGRPPGAHGRRTRRGPEAVSTCTRLAGKAAVVVISMGSTPRRDVRRCSRAALAMARASALRAPSGRATSLQPEAR